MHDYNSEPCIKLNLLDTPLHVLARSNLVLGQAKFPRHRLGEKLQKTGLRYPSNDEPHRLIPLTETVKTLDASTVHAPTFPYVNTCMLVNTHDDDDLLLS